MKYQHYGPLGFAVLLLAAVFNVAALYMSERSFVELRDTAAWVRYTLTAQKLIEQLYRLAVDAEAGQRGYLLTLDTSFLAPYSEARAQIHGKLGELRDLIGENPAQAAQITTTARLIDERLAKLQESLDLKRKRGDDALREFLVSHQGQVAMQSLRQSLDTLAAGEGIQNDRRFQVLAQHRERIRRWFLIEVGINLLLVAAGGMFLAQDALRRRREVIAVSERNTQLAHAVEERTAELTELSHYLQRVREDEKARIAREIHDDLGGTLAAANIDLRLLSDRLPGDDPRQARIARIMAAVDDAVQVKRRIIEDLRPAILDNLGIGAALRWQCSEHAKRSGRPCRAELEDENLRLSPAYSIAFYRIVQEALTNIAKYADAKQVRVSLRRRGGRWLLRVVDDGIGIESGTSRHPTAHGLVSMRERARALGGEFAIHGRRGRGTVVEVRVPIEGDSGPP